MGLTETLRNGLQTLSAGRIFFDEPAAAHASLCAGGSIDALAFPETIEDVASMTAFLHNEGIPFMPVGNWTNLLVRDGGFRGVFISLAGLSKLALEQQGAEGSCIFAEAGCPMAEMVKTAAAESLTGAEFCAGIPGSIGGAIRMNAGAYGGEIKDITEEITIVDRSGRIRMEKREKLKFVYRNLDFPADSIIVAGRFRLHPGHADQIEARIKEILKTRREKHPLELPNAGSIFKNPAGCPAGRLIEEAGLGGCRIGDAEVSEKHGNFIVNRGRATAGEIIALIEMIGESVFHKTGRILEPEIRIVGEP